MLDRREIIDTGWQEAESRLDKARRLIGTRHREARESLRNEMIDIAVHIAMEELPKHMAPDIEHALTDRF